MKKLLLLAGVVLLFAACNNNKESSTTEDPNKTQPVSEAIPDSMKLVNDSTIVPDTIPRK